MRVTEFAYSMSSVRAFSKSETRPAYGASEAARYVRLPIDRAKRWADLLRMPSETAFPLSFANLLQLHLLKSMRVEHRIPLQRVRRALPVRRERSKAFLLQQQ